MVYIALKEGFVWKFSFPCPLLFYSSCALPVCAPVQSSERFSREVDDATAG